MLWKDVAMFPQSSLVCDVCGEPDEHFFLEPTSDMDIWRCRHCVTLEFELLGFLTDKCLNSMEVCRLINGFETRDVEGCYVHGFGFVTRPERCNFKERGCTFWSLVVYNALRKAEKNGWIKSVKMRWADDRRGHGKRTDVFRFWFKDEEAFRKRIAEPERRKA